MSDLQLIEKCLQSEIDPAFAGRADLILRKVSELQPAKILDAGCGRGFYLKMLTAFDFVEEVIGVDLGQDYLDVASDLIADDSRFNVREGSVTKLPFPAESFDFVICSEILEHVPDDKAALSELTRVLKPGGTLAISVPSARFPIFWDPLNWLLMRIFGTHVPKNIHWLAGIWADHERLYTAENLTELVSTQLKVDSVRGVIGHCWPFSHFLYYGLGKNLIRLFGMDKLDRFSFDGNKKISKLLAKLCALPAKMFDRDMNHDRAVNIVLIASH